MQSEFKVSLCFDNSDVPGTPTRDLAHRLSGVSAIVGFMEKHPDDSTVQYNGCMAIASLCRHHAKNHAEFEEKGGFPVVLAALKQHGPSSEHVACHAVQCLAVMAVPGENVHIAIAGLCHSLFFFFLHIDCLSFIIEVLHVFALEVHAMMIFQSHCVVY